jgi:hypothetical protein
MCAILSPTFRVRDFDVKDVASYAVDVQYDGVQGAVESAEVFTVTSPTPQIKAISLFRSNDFNVKGVYKSPDLVPGNYRDIVSCRIRGVKADEEGKPAKVKVKAKIDANGIFRIDSAQVRGPSPCIRRKRARRGMSSLTRVC